MCKHIFPLILLLFAQQLGAQNCLTANLCPGATVDYCDLSENNSDSWNESYWLDNANQIQDLSETAVSASFHFTDTCGGAVTIYYLLFLDLNNDGTLETVVDSRDLPAANTVLYGNGPNPPYDDGTPRSFDERPVPPGQQYRFAIEMTQNAGEYTAQLRWNTDDAPLNFIDPLLPYGNHVIRWVAEKSGGEQLICEYGLHVHDCKPPIVVCLNGVSINIMPTQMVTLWTTDFLQYMQDNATPNLVLELGVRKSGQGTGFPLNGNGAPQASVTFDCSEIGTQIVELWARDAEGNSNYCELYVIVMDALGNCAGGTNLNISLCARQWCSGALINHVGCSLASVDQGIPPLILYDETPDAPDGCFNYSSNTAIGQNYVLSPILEDDVMNGVNALDLVRMSQHILSTNLLPSPYSIIAADVNQSNSVTSFDLVLVRNLIVGFTSDLLQTSSWRFIDAGFSFSNPINPFSSAPFPETTPFSSSADTSVHFDLIGIKMGDVDCSAIPGIAADEPDERSLSLLSLPDLFLEKNETAEIVLSNVAPADWLALQFGLLFDPQRIQIETIEPGELPGDDNQAVGQPETGHINFVWYQPSPATVAAGTPLLRLRIRALAPVQLREAVHFTPNGLKPRVYDPNGTSRAFALLFGQPGDEQAAAGAPFPNPTTDGTSIPLFLPVRGDIQITLTDLQGRLVFSQQKTIEAGATQVDFPAEAFLHPGLFIWQIRASEAMFSGKVVKE